MGEDTKEPAQEFMEMMTSRQKPMLEAEARGDSAVQQFYRDAVVFVTGGSGFLGKLLIEKLLRATKISKLFILLRSKKGKPIQQRLDEMLQDPAYDLLKEQQPNFADKIVPVAGDVAELRLGLSDKDWQMLSEQVDIIFHMAATTRFDEKLRVATLINVRGAREAILLGKACKKLRSYVHVSTAYSYACDNLIDSEVLEDFYKSPVDPEALIKLVETAEDERLDNMTSSLIKNWPNTYSFAKSVAEETVRSLSDDLPLCVVRPAIVVPAWKEPSPGWVDISNVFGASGLILGVGLGLMHAVFADNKTRLGLIPVDYVTNSIVTAAWETGKSRAAGEIKTKIYTVTASTRNTTTWGDLRYYMNTVCAKKYYSAKAPGYAFAWQTNNSVLFWIYSWFLQIIPAYIIDGICLILGKERRFVKLAKKMYHMSTVLSYFTINHWQFVDKNTATLYDRLSPADKEIFDFDVNKINWAEYQLLWCLGLRKFIVKDGLVDWKYALRKQYILGFLTYVVGFIYVYSLYKLIYLVFCVLTAFVSIFW